MDFGLQVKAKEEKKKVNWKQIWQYNKKWALASIKYSEFYGRKGGESTIWPTRDMLREKSDEALKQLRLSKIVWGVFKDDEIASLQFILNDGKRSDTMAGACKFFSTSFEFPEDKPIRSIRVLASNERIHSLVFLDRDGREIKKV